MSHPEAFEAYHTRSYRFRDQTGSPFETPNFPKLSGQKFLTLLAGLICPSDKDKLQRHLKCQRFGLLSYQGFRRIGIGHLQDRTILLSALDQEEFRALENWRLLRRAFYTFDAEEISEVENSLLQSGMEDSDNLFSHAFFTPFLVEQGRGPNHAWSVYLSFDPEKGSHLHIISANNSQLSDRMVNAAAHSIGYSLIRADPATIFV